MSMLEAIELETFLEPSEFSTDRVVGCLLAEWAKRFGARNLVYVYSDMKRIEPAVAEAMVEAVEHVVDVFLDVSDVACYVARGLDVLPLCERWTLRFGPVASGCACHDVQVLVSLIGSARG